MPAREPRTVRVDPEVWSAFVKQVIEWEGQKHGELGRHVENALEEYIDNDRLNRIEDKVDTLLENADATHAHKATPTEKKADIIATKLGKVNQVVIPTDKVETVIANVAGHDSRTIKQYKHILKRQGLAYNHPTSSVWTVDKEQWMGWATDHVANNPTVEIGDVVDDYPIRYDEFEREMVTVEGEQ